MSSVFYQGFSAADKHRVYTAISISFSERSQTSQRNDYPQRIVSVRLIILIYVFILAGADAKKHADLTLTFMMLKSLWLTWFLWLRLWSILNVQRASLDYWSGSIVDSKRTIRLCANAPFVKSDTCNARQMKWW